MRIIYTLLLFAIMAGATTIATDAYAQSNTERIKAIHETVLSMNGTLTALVAPSDDDGITSSITSFGDILNEILVVAQSNQQTVSELASIMADMRTDLSEVHAALSTQDGANLAEDIGFLTSTVNRNHAIVLDRLDTIEATLSSIEGRLVSTPTTGSPTVAPGTTLVRDMVTQEVSAYTYKTNGIQRTINGEEVYDLDLTFSCTGPANIDEIRTNVRGNTHREIISNASPHATTEQNYLTVDGRVLYDSRFEASSGSYLVFIRSVSFDNLESLATGDTLDFESRQHEVGGQIAASTRSAPGFSYEITVEYLADRNTTCAIGTGTGSIGTTGTGVLPKSGTILLDPTLGTGLIRNFNETISCNNNPVDITSIETGVVGWQAGLARFAELTLTFLDGSNDDAADVEIDFNSDDGTLVAPTYPISFSNGDLRVSGKIPNAENLLIEIDYNTVRGGSCSVVDN